MLIINMEMDVDLCEDEVGLRSFLNGKLVVLLLKSTLLWSLMEDFIITRTRKRKKRLVLFLCAFLRTKKLIYTPIPSCPSLPSLGAFSVT